MEINLLTLGAYQTNCYILCAPESQTCAVIDPGYAPEKILAFLADKGLSLDAILLTHGHFDHVGGVEALVKATGCALWMHQSDYTQFKSAENDFFYPIHDCDFCEVHFCEEGELIHAGGLTFSVMHTPGHTWGSVCYLCENALFSGDTLFAGSCGRVDFPGSSPAQMRFSLARLAEIEEDLTIYPGHGNRSTLSTEKRTNPFF